MRHVHEPGLRTGGSSLSAGWTGRGPCGGRRRSSACWPFALIVWQLAIPRPYYTGTDSVDISSVVANVNPGQTLCVPGLDLPAGTGQVQLALVCPAATSGSRCQCDRLAGGKTTVSRAGGPTTGGGTRRSSVHRSRLRAESPASVPATVCVRPLDGPVGVGGMAGLPSAISRQARRCAGRTARRGLVPAASREGALAVCLGWRDLLRAALFRPGVVGPWTYPVLLFVSCCSLAMGCDCWHALRARPAALRVYGRTASWAAVITLVAFVNAGSWALITPVFNAPDEPDHFAYGQYLATTGHAPRVRPMRAPNIRLTRCSP